MEVLLSKLSYPSQALPKRGLASGEPVPGQSLDEKALSLDVCEK
jgi:hypothetical protein